jgi:hypothetical protein
MTFETLIGPEWSNGFGARLGLHGDVGLLRPR